MRFSLLRRRRAARFAQLLDEAEGGRRQRLRTRYDGELHELLALRGQLVEHTPDPELDQDFRDGLRVMLVATAEREGLGATAAPATPDPTAGAARHATAGAAQGAPAGAARRAPVGAARRCPRWQNWWSRGPRARTAALVGVAIGAIAFAGISTASDDAVPGHPLYGVKRSTERAQLVLASSDVGRGQLYLGFAETRLAEAVALADDLTRVLEDMDRDTGQGVRLLTTAATNGDDLAALELVDAFVDSQRATLERLADHVSAPDQRQVTSSLQLLDEVEQRADQLRQHLTHDCRSMTTVDDLGPVPGDCAALP